MYRINEFARKAGVTVRALHYYHQLGLLKPAGRTEKGYRVYSDADLARLEQVVVLKFLGFPLAEIRQLLNGRAMELLPALRFQRQALQEKQRRLGSAIQAIEEAENALANSEGPNWQLLPKIIEVIEMQNDHTWVRRYYSEEALADLDERGKDWTPEKQAKATQDWADLGRDITAAMNAGADPAGEVGRALASRWKALIDAFTGGNPQVEAGLKALYADRPNWPQNQWEMPYGKESADFIQKALAARR
jgi:DNA-binding transcriptional MerR regulator